MSSLTGILNAQAQRQPTNEDKSLFTISCTQSRFIFGPFWKCAAPTTGI